MTEIDPFERAIEQVVTDRSPRAELETLDAEQQRMVRMAQMLRGSQGQEPSELFRKRLHDDLFPSTASRISRRSAFFSGIGALAAGILAGVGLDRWFGSSSTRSGQPAGVAAGKVRWTRVALASEVPPGSVKSFMVGEVAGFLVNQNGNLHAMSRICTHMGCTLTYRDRQADLLCPCHGARFNLAGQWQPKPGTVYKVGLPKLPTIPVRVTGDHVEVWTA